MDMHILASIYDIKGMKDNVVKIYRKILVDCPNDIEAEESLRRLATKNLNIVGLNQYMYDCFVKANSTDDLNNIERWLIGD